MSMAGGMGRLAQILGVNAVPVAGFFGAGWSQGTALAVYWIEGALGLLFVAGRILLHRRWTQKAGHFRAGGFERPKGEVPPVGSGSFLGSYLSVAVPFTLVHGLFLGVLLFAFLPQRFPDASRISLEELGTGTLGVAAFLVLGFVIDAVGLRQWSFRSLELATERTLGRIFIVHLTILFGVAASVYFEAPAALFGVFAGLKFLYDFGSFLPYREPGLEPPRWLRFMDSVRAPDGTTFRDHWRAERAKEASLRAENELPFRSP